MDFKVQIFEDDLSLLNLLKLAFSSQGYKVQGSAQKLPCTLFSSADSSCFNTTRCADAILVDIRLVPAGLEALKRLRKCGCKIAKTNLAIMGTTLTDDHKLTIERLGYHPLKKPFRLKELYTWIETCEVQAR